MRILPATDGAGCVFAGPGVDVRGEPAGRILAQAAPLLAPLDALDPSASARVRTFSVDFRAPRVLLTLEAATPGARPEVLRVDGGALLASLLAAADALAPALALVAGEALARRNRPVDEG